MKLLICDDMKSLCEYYAKVFSKTSEVEVVGTAQNGDECKVLVQKTQPDILLLDIQMRTNDEGLEVIKDLLEIKPDLKIIMLTAHRVEDYVFRAFSSGAVDFLYKTAENGEIVSKVLDVYQNKAAIDADIAAPLTKKLRDVMKMQKSLLYTVNQITKLSKSEISVLRGIYYGKSYREIAAERYVEEGTIRAQASGILRKFETKSMKSLIKSLKEMELFEFIDLYYSDQK